MAGRAGGAGVLLPAIPVVLWEGWGSTRVLLAQAAGSGPAAASSAAQLTGHGILARECHTSCTQGEARVAIADTSPGAL